MHGFTKLFVQALKRITRDSQAIRFRSNRVVQRPLADNYYYCGSCLAAMAGQYLSLITCAQDSHASAPYDRDRRPAQRCQDTNLPCPDDTAMVNHLLSGLYIISSWPNVVARRDLLLNLTSHCLAGSGSTLPGSRHLRPGGMGAPVVIRMAVPSSTA